MRLAPAFLLLALPAAAQTRFGDRHAMLPVDDDSTESAVFQDLDGDGDLDLVFGNGLSQNRLLMNDGTGAFLDATANLPADSLPADALVAADFDGDGLVDLFVGNGFGGSPNRLYLAVAPAVFQDVTATHLPVDADGTEDAAAGDVDGDGDLDLVLANDGEPVGQQNRVYLNDGAGHFTDATASSFPVGFDESEGMALVDLDGDLDLDAVFCNQFGQNTLHLNDGTGVFTDATANMPADAAHDSEAIYAGDLDGDGDADVLIGNSGTGDRQNRFYENDGTGHFTDATAARLPIDADDTEGLAVGDVDGDGDPDVLCINFFQPDRLYLNAGAGLFTDAPASALPAYFPLSTKAHLGDADGDGDLDLVVLYSDHENRLYLNDGHGSFTAPATHLPQAFQSTRAALVFDADGDGDLDSLLGGPNGTLKLGLNNGAAVMSDASGSLPAGPVAASALAAGDLDGDGDSDLFIGTSGAEVVLENDGAGVFTGTLVGAGSSNTKGVALGDVDADGDLDVFAAALGANHLWLNDGAGAFTDGSAGLPASASESRAVALGDVDHDGDLDAVVGNGLTAGELNELLLGDGLGAFTAAGGALPPDVDETGAVALGDVNGDGDLDLVVGNGANAGAPNRLYLGDGIGGFSAGTLPAESAETCAVVLADLDGDGDLDLATGNGCAHVAPDGAAFNDGLGAFTSAPDALPPRVHRTASLVAGDLDGDGDLDLLVGTWLGQSRVLLNLERQVAWRGVPRIGKPLTFDVDGPPGEPWFLAYSIGSVVLPLPPFGTLYLNPSSLVVLGSGVLDGAGTGKATFPIPGNPSAVGLDLPWQLVVGFAPRLGNLERALFTDL